MELKNTIKALNTYGAEVVKRARRNLKISKKIDGKNRVTENTGKLGKSLAYKINKNSNGMNLRFISGVPYADFMEQGVKGSVSSKKAPNSPYKFKGKNIKEGVIENWVRSPKIKLRDKDGKFIKKDDKNIRQASFMIGRSIATKGLSPRNYMQDAIEETKQRFRVNLREGLVKDLKTGLNL